MEMNILKEEIKEYKKKKHLNSEEFLLYLIIVKDADLEKLKKSYHEKKHENFKYKKLTENLLSLSRKLDNDDCSFISFVKNLYFVKSLSELRNERESFSKLKMKIAYILDGLLKEFLIYQHSRTVKLSPYLDKDLIRFLYNKKIKNVSKTLGNVDLFDFRRKLSLMRIILKNKSVIKTINENFSNNKENQCKDLESIRFSYPILSNGFDLIVKANEKTEEYLRKNQLQKYMQLKEFYTKNGVSKKHMWDAGLFNINVYTKNEDGEIERNKFNLNRMTSIPHFARIFQENKYGLSANLIIQQIIHLYLDKRCKK